MRAAAIHLARIVGGFPRSDRHHAITDPHPRPADKTLHIQHFLDNLPTEFANLLRFFIRTGRIIVILNAPGLVALRNFQSIHSLLS